MLMEVSSTPTLLPGGGVVASGQQLAFPFVVLQQYYTFQVPNDARQVQPLPPSTQAGVLFTNMASTTSQVLLAPYSLPPSGYGPSQSGMS